MKKKYASINNSKWKCLPMESLQQGTIYTFSLNPESQPAMYAENRIQKWYAGIVKDLSKIKHAEYHLKLEMSRLGRLHYHGTIRITTVWKFYLEDIAKLCAIGSFEIDGIDNMDEWQRYMDKNEVQMKEMCLAHGIPLTIDAKQIKNVVTDSLNYNVKIAGIQKKLTEIECMIPSDSESEDL